MFFWGGREELLRAATQEGREWVGLGGERCYDMTWDARRQAEEGDVRGRERLESSMKVMVSIERRVEIR